MITEAEAINLGIKYKKENPKCFHSAKYCAKKILQHQTYKWFEADMTKSRRNK